MADLRPVKPLEKSFRQKVSIDFSMPPFFLFTQKQLARVPNLKLLSQ